VAVSCVFLCFSALMHEDERMKYVGERWPVFNVIYHDECGLVEEYIISLSHSGLIYIVKNQSTTLLATSTMQYENTIYQIIIPKRVALSTSLKISLS